MLFALRESLYEQQVVRQLLESYPEQPYRNKVRVSQSKLKEARRLQKIVIGDNDEVSLQYSQPAASRRLSTVD